MGGMKKIIASRYQIYSLQSIIDDARSSTLYKAVMISDPIDEATALAALEDGANANIIEISAGVSALFISTQRGNTRLVQKLLELGARVDLESFTTGESARVVSRV